MIRQPAPADGKLRDSFPAHDRWMKQSSSSVEALYALVFAVCVLVALLMLTA
jgi:hypothetical protein